MRVKEKENLSVLNLFFFRTESEAICSCLIANNLKQKEDCCFFSYKPKPYNVAKKMSQVNVVLLHNERQNILKRNATIKNQIKQVCSLIKNHEKIVIHLGLLYNSTTNYCIAHIINYYPHIKLAVHIIPHGLKTQRMLRLGIKSRTRLKIKNWARRVFGLSFYNKVYDSCGFTSPITEKVYVFPGFEEEVRKYHRNVAVLPVGGGIGNRKQALQNKMLIIGQKNINGNHMAEEQALRIPQKIIAIADENKIDQIDYLPHPRRRALEIYDKSFNMVETEYSVEILVIENAYKIVASFSSTGLIFSKLVSGNSPTRFISFGANLSEKQDELDNILQVMRNIGIEIVDA